MHTIRAQLNEAAYAVDTFLNLQTLASASKGVLELWELRTYVRARTYVLFPILSLTLALAEYSS